MAKKKFSQIPAYYGLRIYAISTLLFMFLVFPITGILLLKHAPDLQKYRTGDYTFNLPDSVRITHDTIAIVFEDEERANILPDTILNLGEDTETNSDNNTVKPQLDNKDDLMAVLFSDVSGLWIRLLIISFVLGLAFNLPFKLYLRKKRKHKPIKDGLFKFCKR